MTFALAVIFGLLGLAFGSFLNVVIDRLPAGKSLAYPPSRCDACGHPLAVKDLFPVFSYIWLRGRCRYCGAHIPLRVPLVELGAGAIFAFLFWKFGLTYQFPLLAFYACVLFVLAVIDLQHRLIHMVIVIPAAVIALVADIFLPDVGVVRGFIGGAIGAGAILLPRLVYPKGMAMGDVYMAAMIGLMTGYPHVIVAILAAIYIGGITAILLVVTRLKKRKDAIPFGPFLALGSLVGLIWGEELIQWYLRLFSISG